jgi:hypothetical protein
MAKDMCRATRVEARTNSSVGEEPSAHSDVWVWEEFLEEVMKKAIICVFGLAVLATPAFAEDYWVVRDSSTKHCTVVTEKPTVTTTTVIGNTAFETRSEAENSMKTTKICSSD